MDPEDRTSAPWAPGHRPVTVPFRSVSEDLPGPGWAKVFRAGWPGWSSWLGDRAGGPEDLRRAVRALRRHMPEFVPVWERLVEVAGGDPRAARFLTFWSPPRYILHCSQAAIVDADGPALIRNYDLDPALNEGFLFRSAWLGRPVMGMVDGLSGLADGVNASGLAVSLAFGGRPEIGHRHPGPPCHQPPARRRMAPARPGQPHPGTRGFPRPGDRRRPRRREQLASAVSRRAAAFPPLRNRLRHRLYSALPPCRRQRRDSLARDRADPPAARRICRWRPPHYIRRWPRPARERAAGAQRAPAQ
jgi:hypothetical protein